jgi:hypothetical protein
VYKIRQISVSSTLSKYNRPPPELSNDTNIIGLARISRNEEILSEFNHLRQMNPHSMADLPDFPTDKVGKFKPLSQMKLRRKFPYSYFEHSDDCHSLCCKFRWFFGGISPPIIFPLNSAETTVIGKIWIENDRRWDREFFAWTRSLC